jgi:hypothetical protein
MYEIGFTWFEEEAARSGSQPIANKHELNSEWAPHWQKRGRGEGGEN